MNNFVTLTLDNGCVICPGIAADDDGYPVRRTAQGCRRVHRLLYQAAFGQLSPGVVLRHKCDNPGCVNVSHLIPGTHADNVADRVMRGRSAHGERNGRAKLTECDVLEVAASELTNCELARRYNVDRATIRDIRNGTTWRHLRAV